MIHSCCRSHLVPSTLLQQPPQTQSHTKVTYILAQIPLQQFQGHFGFPREGKSHRNFIVEDGTQATWQFGGVEDGGQQISAPPPPCSTPAIPPGCQSPQPPPAQPHQAYFPPHSSARDLGVCLAAPSWYPGNWAMLAPAPPPKKAGLPRAGTSRNTMFPVKRF